MADTLADIARPENGLGKSLHAVVRQTGDGVRHRDEIVVDMPDFAPVGTSGSDHRHQVPGLDRPTMT